MLRYIQKLHSKWHQSKRIGIELLARHSVIDILDLNKKITIKLIFRIFERH